MGNAEQLKERFQRISGGRVLDVTTGGGGFVEYLVGSLQDYIEVIGIDSTDKGFEEARKKFEDSPVEFMTMDAAAMSFEDAVFDTVAVANSLHHLRDIDCTLSEMYRVLKPGGTMIVVEMFRNNQNSTQLTHVLLHHWWAQVNRLEGIAHFPTMTRSEILYHVKKLGLRDMDALDYADPNADPKDAKTLDHIAEITNEYLAKIKGIPEHAGLYRDGISLLERARKIGFTWATELVVIGAK